MFWHAHKHIRTYDCSITHTHIHTHTHTYTHTHLMFGTRMLLIPPSLTLILRHRLERVWGDGRITFLDWTHWVATPNSVSPTRFTSATSGQHKTTCSQHALHMSHVRMLHACHMYDITCMSHACHMLSLSPYTGVFPGRTTMISWRSSFSALNCLKRGSTLSTPCT